MHTLKHAFLPINHAKLSFSILDNVERDPAVQTQWTTVLYAADTEMLKSPLLRGKTGRYKSSRPNLQGLPSVYREAVMQDGKVMVYADFSTLHPRLLAGASLDFDLMATLDGDDDFYYIVCDLLDRPRTTDNRKAAKITMNAWLNGGSKPETLYSGFEPMPTVRFDSVFGSRWPKAQAYRSNLIQEADGDHTAVSKVFQGMEAKLLDTAITGLASDGYRVLLPMHDALLLSSRPENVEGLVNSLHKHMAKDGAPITVGVGTSWGTLQPYEEGFNYYPLVARVEKPMQRFTSLLDDIKKTTDRDSLETLLARNEFWLTWGAARGGAFVLQKIRKQLGTRTQAGRMIKEALEGAKAAIVYKKTDELILNAPWVANVLLHEDIVLSKVGAPVWSNPATLQIVIAEYCNFTFGSAPSFDQSLDTFYIGETRFDEQEHIDLIVRELSSIFSWVGNMRPAILESFISLSHGLGVNSLTDALTEAMNNWDGVRRISGDSNFAGDVLKAPEVLEIDNIAMRKWFIGAVDRAFHPGCDMSLMPLLYGKQGVGKDYFFDTIGKFALRPGMETRTKTISKENALGSANAIRVMATAWITVAPELSGLSHHDQEVVKAAITNKTDTIVPKYKNFAVDVERRGVLGGSTNNESPLTDATGSRRFHVIRVGEIAGKGDDKKDMEKIRLMVPQIWGEAAHLLFKEGETSRFTEGERKQQEAAAELYTDENILLETFINTLETKFDKAPMTADVFKTIDLDSERTTSAAELRRFRKAIVAGANRRGWTNKKSRRFGRCWHKIEGDQPWDLRSPKKPSAIDDIDF